MALAQFRKVYGKQGAGRFVVSEGVAPSAYLLPHDALPTLYNDDEDDRFEVVITKGTILGLVTDANGDSRVVPCGTNVAGLAGFADSAGLATGGADNVAVPIGAAQYDLYRPFDKGTSQGAGWITHGYVEWPLIDGVWTKTDAGTNADAAVGTVSYTDPANTVGWTQGYNNTNLTAGSLVASDAFGRPVAAAATADFSTVVGKVVEVERFATNFDDGLLSYMGLDEPALEEVYAIQQPGQYQGRLGIRANLDKVNAVGAVRVNLTI